MKNVLLLTSTIRPKPGQPNLRVVDPSTRLAEYHRALAFNVLLVERGVVDGIVYADNSGFDLTPLITAFPSAAIEWVSFYGLDYDQSFHRGYGEFRLVDRAYELSQTLSALEPRDRVWKVTGRYIVKNLAKVVRFTPRDYDLFCEVRGEWAEMSLMAWNRDGYEMHIKDLWRELSGGMVPELVLGAHLRAQDERRGRVLKRAYWPPFVIGQRGSDGSHFQGRLTWARFAISASVKSIQLPWRWARHSILRSNTVEQC
jgi:hypothetical protein